MAGVTGSERGIDRTADYMGMLATVCATLQDTLEKHDVDTRVLSAIEMRQIAEPYIKRKQFDIWKRSVVILLLFQ